jgi:signal transduction histidine kinase
MQRRDGARREEHFTPSETEQRSWLARLAGQNERLARNERCITNRNHAEENLHVLSLSLLAAQDEERRCIARELHDSVRQYLAHAKMSLEDFVKQPDRKVASHGQIVIIPSLFRSSSSGDNDPK